MHICPHTAAYCHTPRALLTLLSGSECAPLTHYIIILYLVLSPSLAPNPPRSLSLSLPLFLSLSLSIIFLIYFIYKKGLLPTPELALFRRLYLALD